MNNDFFDVFSEAISPKESFIKAVCEGRDTLVDGKSLVIFTGLEKPLKDYKYFIGVNVKTSTTEPVKPIQGGFSINYIEPDKSKLDKIIPNGLDNLCNKFGKKPFDVTFRWKTPKNDPQVEIVDCNPPDGKEIITTFFKNLGPNIEETESGKTGYHVIGHVIDNSEWKEKEEITFYVWIRTVDYDIRKDGQPLSYILAICENKEALDKIKEKELEIYDYIMLVKAGYRKKIEDERVKEAIKSAIASIMSRNMSHNLGSHYLYYTKNQLSALADKHSKNSDADSPEIRGAAKVLGYMQARMDYLATIVAGDKYPYGSVFFKGQIFDELTIDDFTKRHFRKEEDGMRQYKRTTNYLLQNIILSENFTRKPVLSEENSPLPTDKKNIRLQIMTATNKLPFTGSSEEKTAWDERKVKLEISKLCIALPGGIMSIHAFFNVVENLIRNSAKYNKEDFKDIKELVYTIRINELEATNNLPVRYEFIIFDNKANANNKIKVKTKNKEENKKISLLDSMNNRLKELKILKNTNELDKNDKGLKEILFSTLWMRSYTYKKSQKMNDILAELDMEKEDSKLDKIRKHAFEYVAVDDNGNIIESLNGETKVNLGIRFEIPKYRMMENVESDELKNNHNLIEKGLNNFTDILCVDETYENFSELKTQFTRVSKGKVNDENNEEEAVKRLQKILQDRFTDFDSYRLSMDGNEEEGFLNLSDENKKKFGIYFQTHIGNNCDELEEMKKYSYCEAISGENFTKTMQNIFQNGFTNNKYKDDASKYFGLKIKEAALTRITLIDERLYNDMITTESKKTVLSLKNIRVLNLKESIPSIETGCDIHVKDLFDGNAFRDNTGDATLFLSIHLGMIEKIIEDNSPWIEAASLKDAPLSDRIDRLMAWLKESFKTEKGEIFISIHSGRGNFSPDLDDSLKQYPFISISAIESTYSNSKYLLAQLFYNTVYIGKGVSNNE